MLSAVFKVVKEELPAFSFLKQSTHDANPCTSNEVIPVDDGSYEGFYVPEAEMKIPEPRTLPS